MLATELDIVGNKVLNRGKKTRVTELFKLENTSFIVHKHWSATRMANGRRSLGQTDKAVQLRYNSNGRQPCAVMFIEPGMEPSSNLLDDLTVRFLGLLQLANEASELGEVVPFDLFGRRHLVPVLGNVLHLDWNFELVYFLAVIPVADGRRP